VKTRSIRSPYRGARTIVKGDALRSLCYREVPLLRSRGRTKARPPDFRRLPQASESGRHIDHRI